ncbi:MAG: TetR/AcrR family transcriptional regulator [Lachnospiraceae bacterium]|nr:TetR/AcrR family transcriptional regulator [Lachnospiraceae bacterium]
MNDKFYTLKKEKQDTMINGAMQIFALCGYRHASTDDMVKASGVSKGLWFHYFDTKAGLYSFVAAYALKYAMLELSMCSIEDGEDYFDVRIKFEVCKMRMIDKYPYMPLFICEVLREEDPDVEDDIADVRERYNDMMQELLLKADYRALRRYDDYYLLTDMLDYTMDTLLMNGYHSGSFSKEEYLSQVKKHMEAMKKVIYRE